MTNTLERYDHTDDGFETANDGDFVSYHDYAALLARAEQAEAERDAALAMMNAQPMALSKALRKLGYLVPISVVSKALRATLAGEEPKP
jgi:ureidoglycolate hydrolase